MGNIIGEYSKHLNKVVYLVSAFSLLNTSSSPNQKKLKTKKHKAHLEQKTNAKVFTQRGNIQANDIS